jgi:hypothetical protein
MLKHVKNVAKENVPEELEYLAEKEITGVIGDPATTGNNALLLGRPYTVNEIKSLGYVGLYINVNDEEKYNVDPL